MRQKLRWWPFGGLKEGQTVRFFDGTDYIVEGTGWRKIRLSDRHRQHAQRKITIL